MAVTSAGGAIDVAWLLVALPALGAAVLLLAGRRSDRWGHLLGVAMPVASFVVAAAIWVQMLGLSGAERVAELDLGTWLSAGTFTVDLGVRVDPLSMTFVLLVTFVGSLIHVYSIAYMEHDPNRRRFFAYLNLFVAAMLLLVLADSYVLLFVGWEGVGLASYLLIGFWEHERPNAVAAKKAFVTNRVGDLGLLTAIMAMGLLFGTTDIGLVNRGAESAGEGWATVLGLLLLLAACGKSAQFPLQAWLGDAMAGPTPVSALIHAATMVTAGVYLVVRSGGIYDAAPTALLVVSIVGAITLLYGAIVGCAKDDIKKTLAASTMSQIGYMMLAAGLGPIGYAFAIFHLLTHGFFKAGLFLGAGSVMHGMNDQVDMRRFGGLATSMKVTWVTMALGWLAIIGVPPFSGFWSKDKIVESAYAVADGQGWQPWVLGTVALVGVGITAFYMSRLFFMTFHGTRRWDDGHGVPGDAGETADVQHPHESPALMTWPMILLAVGSAVLGGALAVGGAFTTWLEPVTGHAEHHEPVLPVPVIMTATFVLLLAGAFLAWRQYAAAPVAVVPPRGSLLTRAARRDLFQDTVNEALLMRPGQYLTRSLVFGDRTVVDGAVTGVAAGTAGSGELLRRLQTGFVRSYALQMVVGIVALVAVVLAVRI
nr:NADH-quinone oxidoreductase subunit L [Actinotalea fermentans]